jgi:hypothetical protein
VSIPYTYADACGTVLPEEIITDLREDFVAIGLSRQPATAITLAALSGGL